MLSFDTSFVIIAIASLPLLSSVFNCYHCTVIEFRLSVIILWYIYKKYHTEFLLKLAFSSLFSLWLLLLYSDILFTICAFLSDNDGGSKGKTSGDEGDDPVIISDLLFVPKELQSSVS